MAVNQFHTSGPSLRKKKSTSNENPRVAAPATVADTSESPPPSRKPTTVPTTLRKFS
jgi:hypothetical protein